MADQDLANWGLLVPCKLQLAADNVLVPRQGFLCTVAQQAWPHFQHVLPHFPGQQGLMPWFDYKQLPLRGNLPIGVLFDLLASADDGSNGLPWELTIHYTGLPDTLVNWHNNLPMHTQYFHALKEACFISRGPDGAAAVMKMNGAAQDALWAAVEKADAARFQAALSALKVVPSERQGATPAVPTRLLLRTAAGSLTSAWDSFMTSRPAPAVNPDGSWTTLRQLLAGLLPQVQLVEPAGTVAAGQSTCDDAGAAAGAVTGSSECSSSAADSGREGAGPEADAASVMGLSASMCGPVPVPGPVASEVRGVSCQAVVSGVVPPLDTPIAWLHAHLHAPDYFLYVVVKRASKSSE